MPHLFHIDLIVVLVCADPFDPYDALFEIDGNDQSIIIPPNFEHDPVCRDDASGRMAAPYTSNYCLPDCPGIHCRHDYSCVLDRGLFSGMDY